MSHAISLILTTIAFIISAFFWVAALCISTPVLATNESTLQHKLFEIDKAAALAEFDTTQKQACLKAFNARYHSQYTFNDTLTFNESMSLGAYDRLYWKGKGNFQRGLIFTGSVTDPSGAKSGNLICYYATTDDRLDFQSAYVLPLQTTKAAVASNGNSNTQASLITLSSKE
jgi:hypothetical protein